MRKNIEPTLKEIKWYLGLKKSENFVIPEYQREYQWDKDKCDQLLQDIEMFISSGASDLYFFGTIIVDCSSNDKFSLIDGQQRTITFLLLLKALLLRLNEVIPKVQGDKDSEDLEAGLTERRKEIMTILYKAEAEEIPGMLKDHSKTKGILILENKSINELYPDEFKKIIEAKDFKEADEIVYKTPRKKKDGKYTNYFRNFKFFYEKLYEKEASELNNFAKIFLSNCEVIEIRSWQVEQAIMMFNSLNSKGLPLSDADIISGQLYSNVDNDKKSEFNERWKSIKEESKKLDDLKITDIDGVLQQFMYINRSKNKDYVRENSVDVTTPGLRRYYTEISKDLLKDPFELCKSLSKITQIWDEIKEYPAIKLLLKFNVNAKLFLMSYLYRYKVEEIDETKVVEICECLLRLFALLEIGDAGYSNTKFKTFLFSENLKFVDESVSIEDIKEDFDKHISENWKEEDVKEEILEYRKNLLVFLNEYIFCKEKSLRFDFDENVNIEHVMPVGSRNKSSIQQDAGVDKDEFDDLVNKLGNKILLEEEINKSLGDAWFRTKKQKSVKEKAGYRDSKYAIARELTNYHKDTWTKEDIEAATTEASERILSFVFNKNSKKKHTL
jgi:uncharacterized protein with ParB-like and HNH nuclease domain